jgi:hypothetical protein
MATSGRSLRPVLAPDEPFDSYGNISWEDEKAHLDNFVIALQRDSNLVGYIIVYAGRQACLGEAGDRALRAKQYVVETHGIDENRVIWVDGGHREKLTIVLQPIERNVPKLTPSPTIKPGEAIVRSCKRKSTKRKLRGPQQSHTPTAQS